MEALLGVGMLLGCIITIIIVLIIKFIKKVSRPKSDYKAVRQLINQDFWDFWVP